MEKITCPTCKGLGFIPAPERPNDEGEICWRCNNGYIEILIDKSDKVFKDKSPKPPNCS